MWRDERNDAKLKGHEDLIKYFELEDVVRKLVDREKPLRATFHTYVKQLGVPRVVGKGTKEEAKQASQDVSGRPAPLITVLKKEIFEDPATWTDTTKDSESERILDSSLLKYLYSNPQPFRGARLAKRTVTRAFMEEDDPRPLDVFVREVFNTKDERNRKSKKGAKRKITASSHHHQPSKAQRIYK
mmetsp:Transcript_24329/g.34025  ORF Transcript_24329/g.34025 Transcript_24329/m.34025 type:complete len:186 (-) Transcript_24329:202-759(-)